MTHVTPWYVDIFNFLVTSTYPIGASKSIKERLEIDAKYYVLHFCHAVAGGGHYGSSQTAQEVLDYELHWPTIFQDAHKFVSTLQCQKTGMAIS
ncbi:hypothetical protein CR513_21440, partial [Mucuna pruriens]